MTIETDSMTSNGRWPVIATIMTQRLTAILFLVVSVISHASWMKDIILHGVFT